MTTVFLLALNALVTLRPSAFFVLSPVGLFGFISLGFSLLCFPVSFFHTTARFQTLAVYLHLSRFLPVPALLIHFFLIIFVLSAWRL